MMKLVVASLLILCFAQVQPFRLNLFEPGNQYRYSYIGHAVTGIPDVDNAQKAGIAIKCTVIVQCLKIGSMIVQLKNTKTAKINDDFYTVDLEKIPFQFESIDTKYAQFIEIPMMVSYDRGLVKQFTSDSKEPEIVTNIKKAVLTMLQVKLDQASPRFNFGQMSTMLSSSSLYEKAKSSVMDKMPFKSTYSDSSNDVTKDDVAVYEVMEDGIAGECETKYIVESLPWPGNPSANVLNVTKIRDYENCNEEVEWAVSTHPTNNCTDCDADEQDPVNTIKVVEYNIRVQPEGAVIERIESRSETVYAPLTTNADEIHTNHSQLMILREVTQSPQPLPQPLNIIQHDTLRYSFPRVDEGIEVLPEDLHKRPLPFLPLSGQTYPQVTRRLIQEVTQEISRNPKVAMINTPLKAQRIADAMRSLPASDLNQILQESSGGRHTHGIGSTMGSAREEEEIKRRVTVDTMLMCGTLPCIAVLITHIEKREIEDSEAAHVLTVLPFDARRPAAPVIEKVLKLCESDIPIKGTQVHKSCWLAFASLVSQACGPDNTTVPVSPGLDTYCNDEQEQKYVQAVAEQLKSATHTKNRLLYVQALSIIGSEYNLDVLRPIIEDDVEVSEMVRVKAIHALALTAEEIPRQVSHLVMPILFDSSETTVVRAAALRIVTKSAPTPELLQKIAALTWTEEDNQLVGLINTAMEGYSNVSYPCYKNTGSYAKQALPFTEQDDDDDVGIQDSQIQIFDDFDDDLNLGTLLKLVWVANNKSIIPRLLRIKHERIIAGFAQTPFKVNIQAKGIETLIKRIFGSPQAFEKMSLTEILRQDYENETPKNYRELFSKLNIDPRAEDSLAISVALQHLTTKHSMYYIDAETILNAIQSGSNSPVIASLLGTGLNFNYQHIFNFGYVKYQIPSSLGFPLYVQVRSPAIVDLRGKISLSVDTSYGSSSGTSIKLPNKVGIHLDIHPTFSVNVMTTMGVVNPMRKIYAAAGVTSKTLVTLPMETKIDWNLEDAKLETMVTPLKHFSGSSEIKLFYHKVKPFTTIYPYNTFDLMAQHSKIITSKDKLDEYTYTVPSELVGIPAVFKVQSDLFWQDRGSFLSYLFEDNSPLSLATLWWATPDFKFREYQLLVDATAASNTEMTMTVDIDSLPSQIQEILHQGQHSLKGKLGFLLGWSKLPWQCLAEGHDASKIPAYDSDAILPRSSYSGVRGRSLGYPESSDDDDDDDDDSDDDQRMGYSIKKDGYKMKTKYSRQKRAPSDDFSSGMRSGSEFGQTQKLSINSETTRNTIKVKVDMAVKGHVSRSVKSVLTLTRDKFAMEDAVALKVSINNPLYHPNDRLVIQADSRIKYPKLPCDYANGLNPDTVTPVTCNVDVSFGTSEAQEKKQIKMQATFSKSQDQKEIERKGKSWQFEQCKEDYKEGKRISDACVEAIETVGELKKINLDIQYYDLPRWMYNVTHKLNNFAKYYWYTHMSVNPIDVQNPEGRLKIKAVFDAEDPTIDVKVFAPHENTFFKDIYVDSISPYLQPPNARASLWRLFLDDLTAGYVPATCKLMSRHIENFDNKTFPAPITNCKHVLAKDCSPQDTFSVLVRRLEGSAKELEVHLRKHKIVAKPSGSTHTGQYTVEIDGKPEQIQQNEIVVLKSPSSNGQNKAIGFVTVIGELLHVRCPYDMVWVKFDGSNVKIEASNLLRGQLCGMCGEFNGDTSSNLIGPQQCEYADPKDFVLSYVVPSSECSAPSPSDKKICPEETPEMPQLAGISTRMAMPSSRRSTIRFDYDDDDDMTSRKYNSGKSTMRSKYDDEDDEYKPKMKSRTKYVSKSTSMDDDDDDDDDDDEDESPSWRKSGYKSSSGLIQQRNKMQYRSGKICFTINTVGECKPGSDATKTQRRRAEFTCFTESSPFAQKLRQQRSQRPLHEMESHRSEFVSMVDEALQCQNQ